MFISSLTERGSTPALSATLSFNHERLKMLAENVANFGTPGYRTKRLDANRFQSALREALDRRGADARRPLRIQAGREVRTDGQGRMTVTPTREPVENILFHDGTNMSLETQMTQLARTGMSQRVATELLRAKFDGLRKAIRGTV